MLLFLIKGFIVDWNEIQISKRGRCNVYDDIVTTNAGCAK
jgi:hypothetical protein